MQRIVAAARSTATRRRVRERLPVRRRRNARVGARVLRRGRGRDRSVHRRTSRPRPARADPEGRAVVPGRRGLLVGALGPAARHRRDGAPRRSRRHRARVDRRRHRLRACSPRTRPTQGNPPAWAAYLVGLSRCAVAAGAGREALRRRLAFRRSGSLRSLRRIRARWRRRGRAPHCSNTDRRSARRQIGGSAASSCASATAAARASPSGTTRLASPMRSASSAPTPRPVRIMSSACALTDEARQTDGAAVDERHAPAPAVHAERGRLGGDAQVAPHRQFDAAGDGEAFDRGDDRLVQQQPRRAHRPFAVAQRPSAARALGDRLEVGAGAEVAVGAGEHGGGLRVVGVEGDERVVRARRRCRGRRRCARAAG